MTKPKLLPCPFCGSKNVTLADESDEDMMLFVITCHDCHVGFSVGGGEDGCCDATEEETVTAWNRRANNG